MIDENLSEMQQRLLVSPFDATLRLAYGTALQDLSRHAEALQQFDLLLGQPGPSAQAFSAAARSLLALGRTEEALERYATARSLAGFAEDPMLENVAASSRRSNPVRLSVLDGAMARDEKPLADNVVELNQARRARVTFADVAGMEDLKRSVRMQIIEPFLRPGLFAKFKKKAGAGSCYMARRAVARP
jgi:tetratricopeptide (TPR) repeat protein